MTEKRIKEIIAKALEVDIAQVTNQSSTQTLAQWDSLGHISVLTALDRALDGKLAELKEMENAYSVESILAVLRQHHLID